MKKLEWNVIYGNFNSGNIETYNIFNHYMFLKDCAKASQECGDDRESFEAEVKKSLAYYFGYKCEWEVVVSHWPPKTGKSKSRFRDKKIDVYMQIMWNWDRFAEYLWVNRDVLKEIEFECEE